MRVNRLPGVLLVLVLVLPFPLQAASTARLVPTPVPAGPVPVTPQPQQYDAATVVFQTPPIFTACASDADCVWVDAACGQRAINRMQERAYRDAVSAIAKDRNCPAQGGTVPEVGCVGHRCTPRNPAPELLPRS